MPIPYRSIPVGTRFGRWVVVGAPSRSPTRRYVYPCQCDCGTEREVAEGGLKLGRSASCGCLNREIISGPRLPLRDRFLAKVRQLSDGCWLWLGHKDPHGYGRIGVDGTGTVRLAHRVAYELFRGTIPTDGNGKSLTLDHLCRNHSCVNPQHLEPVTAAENTSRGLSPSMLAHRAETCVRGHPNAEHAYYRDGVRIYCRTCERENQRARYRRKTAKGQPDGTSRPE